MEIPSTPPEEITRSDTCADIMREILGEVTMDLGAEIQPDSPTTHEIMDEEIPSATVDGPDGKTTLFWCEKANGACSFSFLLREGKPSLPPELTEEAVAIHGVCLSKVQLARALKRARQATRGALGDRINDPEWQWLKEDE